MGINKHYNYLQFAMGLLYCPKYMFLLNYKLFSYATVST